MQRTLSQRRKRPKSILDAFQEAICDAEGHVWGYLYGRWRKVHQSSTPRVGNARYARRLCAQCNRTEMHEAGAWRPISRVRWRTCFPAPSYDEPSMGRRIYCWGLGLCMAVTALYIPFVMVLYVFGAAPLAAVVGDTLPLAAQLAISCTFLTSTFLLGKELAVV